MLDLCDNHSIAYCLLGYLCAYYRYYYPVEFITAFLNNAANDEDICNGTMLAKLYGIRVTPPKFGISRGEYSCNAAERIIAKGLASIKYIGGKLAENLYILANQQTYELFTDVLLAMKTASCTDARQLNILLHIDFFDHFGNQRELENVVFFWQLFKEGEAKQIRKDRIAGSYIEEIIMRCCDGKTKSGAEAASYKIKDAVGIVRDCERKVLSLHLPDYGVVAKVRRYTEAMGYTGYISGLESDRKKLFVREVMPVKRKSDGKQFGYGVCTQSIGSGVEARFTVFNRVFDKDPIQKGDVILLKDFTREGKYFTLTSYSHLEEN